MRGTTVMVDGSAADPEKRRPGLRAPSLWLQLLVDYQLVSPRVYKFSLPSISSPESNYHLRMESVEAHLLQWRALTCLTPLRPWQLLTVSAAVDLVLP